MHRLAKTVVVTAALMTAAATSWAQWQPDGVFVSAAPNDQTQTVATSDGAGGALIAWYDTRNGVTSVYAQRVDASGVPLWTTDGVVVSAAVNVQDYPQVASDGAGGAIVTWEDRRSNNWDIYAQRLNASGVAQWAGNGIAVCALGSDQRYPQILGTGTSGAFIVWVDYRSGTNIDLYGARVTSAGALTWGPNGNPICTAAGDQINPVLLTDGGSGFFVAWEDYRSGNGDIYMQQTSGLGFPVWTTNGLAVCSFAYDQIRPRMVTDGAGGAILAWDDRRSSQEVYLQRMTSLGVPWWTWDGVEATPFNNINEVPSIAPDGAGGVFVAWQQKLYSATAYTITAQRFNASGVRLWYQYGVDVSDNISGNHVNPKVVPDGEGGIVVAWRETRYVDWDVYAQRVNGAAKDLWQDDGIAITRAYGDKDEVSMIADGAGGAILSWIFNPSGQGYEIMAQRIDNVFGYWGHSEPLITSVADVPADQGGKVKINWNASDQDRDMVKTITYYSVWRATDPAAASTASVLDGPGSIGANFSGSAFYREKTPTIDYYWEWVGNQDAVLDSHYSFAAQTRADSVAGNLAVHQFRVVAHTADEFVLFKSLPAFGYSVDNLAPPAPLLLTAQRVGSDVQLRWNRAIAPDLRNYALYRATSSGVTPVPIHFLASSDDTLAIDAGAPASALYYVVTAYDVHANQGPPSNEASVQATTGVGNTPPIAVLTVLQNHPNPFAAATDFEIGLPVSADISVDVFDVAGRRVSTLAVRGANAGWNRIPFAGRDDHGRALASGVYFYRVAAAGSTITRKLVIAR